MSVSQSRESTIPRAGPVRRPSAARAILFGICFAQLVTVAITWRVWQVRTAPPNLPVAPGLPDLPFGWLIVASLVVAVARPRLGVPIHLVTLIIACLFDQFRLEPQFIGLAVMMIACLGNPGMRLVRWFLTSMWFWAGLHKLLSPDWLGHASFTLVEKTGLDPQSLYLPFAIVVACSEIALGLLAVARPRWAAPLAVALHFGIVLFMSPLFAGMNDSVIAWNLTVAGVGFWVLRSVARPSQSTAPEPESTDPEADERSRRLPGWEIVAIAVLAILPAGFYLGWVDRSLCHVLYSDNLPRGIVTNRDGFQQVRGWQGLEVPFPSERRLYRRYFQRTASPGDKLHVSDPRPWLDDQFYVMTQEGCVAIDADRFFAVRPGEVAGVGLDRKRSIFALAQAGVQMKRERERSMIYAVAFTPENYDRDLLAYLEGLPNLMQIQLAGTAIRDRDLSYFRPLRMLMGLGLSHTKITDEGLRQLSDLPYLDYVETEGTSIREYGPD